MLLLAEDDPNDVVIFRHAVETSARKAALNIHLEVVSDGTEAIEYLNGKGKFANRAAFPFPHVVVLDLKMARLSALTRARCQLERVGRESISLRQ